MSPDRVPVKYIVFDLGKVLIDYCYDDFFALMRSRGARVAGEEDFLKQVRLLDYEHGHLSCQEFLAGMNRLLAEPLSREQLMNAWNGLFAPIPEMLELARELKNRYPVYLLSNIGKLHWDFLSSTYDLDAYCHDRLASFEAGAMKPAADIYRSAQRRFSLEPEHTLFIDDKPENISGAAACGWQAFVHCNPSATRKRLHEIIGSIG
jgi:putative hydrolase of the HAD superfamily